MLKFIKIYKKLHAVLLKTFYFGQLLNILKNIKC